MKSIQQIFTVLSLSTLFLSCSQEDDEHIVPVLITAQLFEDTSVMENSPTLEFKINLDKPAPENGHIILQVTATNDAAFETNPPVVDGEIEIPILKGRNFATLEFTPQNDDLLQENESVTFQLFGKSNGIVFGSKHTTTVEIAEDEAAVSASFGGSVLSAQENAAEGVEVLIEFSHSAPGEGSLIVQLEGNTDNYYVNTQPALDSEQKIMIPVASGTSFTTFRVYPKDNALLQNHKTLKLRILEATGVVIKGNRTEADLVLLDDEIQGRIKSVQTISTDGKRSKRTWEYTSDGKVDRVIWEKEPAQLTHGTDYYHYSEDGAIRSVAPFMGDGEDFIWEDGKIVQSVKLTGFFKVGYSTYDYNSAGKIQKKTVYMIKADGTFTATTRHEYEYFSDGNMKKESTYIPGSNNTWVLDSSLAYDSYTDRINPAPVEIIPTQKAQQHLPLYYTIKGDGVDFSHYYIYEYNSQDMVTKRTSLTETTTYSYY